MVDGKIYAIGGWNTRLGGTRKVVEEYDSTMDRWTEKANMLQLTCRFATAVVDGKIYAINFSNEVFVWQEGRKAKLLENFTMIDEKYPKKVVCDASIVPVDSAMYIRTPTKLICVEK